MAHGGIGRRIRRWKRRRLTQAPSAWPSRLSTLGIVILLLGAMMVAVYVAKTH